MVMEQQHHRFWRTGSAWFTALAVLLSWAAAHAETLYVSGYREVMLRTGPSVEHRIIAVLKTGNPVEVVGTEGDYNLVSLPDGRQGYVPRNFLTGETPPQRRLAELTARVEAQGAELERLRSQNRQLAADHDKLGKDHASDKRLLQRLQQESSEVERDERLSWFLAGAGVLLIGWVMGWTRLRLRRKTRARSFT